MGQAKILKCKKCGYEWLHYEGTGLQGIELTNNTEKGGKDNKVEIRCPKCNTTNVETDYNKHILWD